MSNLSGFPKSKRNNLLGMPQSRAEQLATGLGYLPPLATRQVKKLSPLILTLFFPPVCGLATLLTTLLGSYTGIAAYDAEQS